MDTTISQALKEAYRVLAPFSAQYRVDFDRYAITIGMLMDIENIKEKRVLDIGTGIGILPVALRILGVHANGMEYFVFPESGNDMFGRKEIDTLKTVWAQHKVEVICHDATGTTTPPPSSQADIVVSEAAIEHLKGPRRFLEQCNELLTPGGHLLISTPNSATLLQRLRFLAGRSPNWPIAEFFDAGESFTGHWREYTLDELTYMIRASNFTILKAASINALAKFKRLPNLSKNFRALVATIAWLIPHGREMNYVLAQKK